MSYDDDPLLKNVPPHDREAERQLVARALLDTRTLGDLESNVPAEWFYDPWLGAIWGAVLKLQGGGHAVNPHSIAAMIDGGGMRQSNDPLVDLELLYATKIAELYDAAPAATNVNYYAKRVKEGWVSRKLVEVGALITGLGWDRDPIADRLEAAASMLDKVAESGGNDVREATAADLVRLVQERLERLRGGVDPAPQSGYLELDDLMRGFQPGEFTVMAARPSMGKTTLLFSLLRRMASDGVPVGVVSLETPNEQVGINWVASRAEFDSRALRDGYVPRVDPPALTQAYSDIEGLGDLFRVVDKGVRTVAQFKRLVRQWKHRHDVKVVAVDYLQLLHGPSEVRKRGRTEETSHVSNELKDIASSLDVHVIALAQLNREVEKRNDKSPLMSDLRDSGQIEQDADVILLLHRPGYYDDEADPLEALVRVAKNRNGATGRIALEFVREQNTFREPLSSAPPPRSQPQSHYTGGVYDPGQD